MTSTSRTAGEHKPALNLILTLAGYAVALVLFIVLRWSHVQAMLVSPVAQIPIIDSKYYLEWGQRVASGLGLGPHPFFMSPLYPLFIAMAGSIGDGFTASTLHLQTFISAITMLLIGRFTAKRISHWMAGPLAAMLFALYAPAIYYDGVLLSASLILFLTMVALVLLDVPNDRLKESSSGSTTPGYPVWWRVAGAGAAIGLSALARPNALILIPALSLMFLWWGWRGNKSGNKALTGKAAWLRTAIIPIVVLTFATLIVVMPAMWRNARLGGEFTLTTSSAGMNFFVGNHAQSNGLYTEVPWLASAEPADEAEGYRQEAMRRTGMTLTDLAASRYWFGEALEWIVSDPGGWIGLEFAKLRYFFHNEESPNNVSYYGAKHYSPVLPSLSFFRFGLLFALAFPGLFLLGGGWRMRLPLALVFAYLVANLLFFVAGEYRYPIVGVLIPAAVYTLFKIVAWIRQRDPIPALRTGIVVIALVLITNIPYAPMRTIASAETDYFNWGSVSYASGDLPNASLLFSAALAERPGWRDAHLQLAFVFRDMGLRDMSDDEFEAAGVTQEDLAQLAAEDELAREWFGTTDLDTLSATTLADLAAKFNILNRHDAALSAATRALQKDSTNAQAALEQAFAQESRGRLHAAVTLYQRLEYKQNSDPMIPYRMAWCYYGLGQGRDAQKALVRAKLKAQELPESTYRDQWLKKLDEAVITLGNY
jgi:tetratricopeptide (TPR) repeat protein